MSAKTETLPALRCNSSTFPQGEWPRIALVTPVFNSGKYIEQTIRSVLAQNYPNLDYFIVDGASTDDTVDIIHKYENQISGWLSEPDNGMYDALNKGFARTSGEIMGWISATDLLHAGALFTVGGVFRDLPTVEWITARPTRLNEEGAVIEVDAVPHWSRERFLAGANRYIQQESTFWRRSLWQRAGGCVNDSMRMAADFELWVRFFRHARLYSVDALIGGFRMHEASMGLQRLDECNRLHDQIIDAELSGMPDARFLRFFRNANKKVKNFWGLRFAWWQLVERPFLSWRKAKSPPVIRFKNNKWVLGG